jgi:hypothetical protein
LKTTQKTPQQFEPPPPGAHIGERTHGLGLGLFVGALLGLLIGAITLLVFQLQRRDAVDEASGGETMENKPTENTSEPINIVQPPIEIPLPEVLPTNNSTPSSTIDLDDQTVPVVVSSSPTHGASAVPTDAQILLTFNVAMDEETITAETVSVFDTTNDENISADFTLSYRQDSKQLTIAFADPGTTLSAKTEYGVLVSTGVRSISGIALETPFRLTFTTK